MAAGIVTIGAVIGALEVISAQIPEFVTKGELLAELERRNVLRIEETKEMIGSAVDPMKRELNWLRQDQLTSRILTIQTSIAVLQGELIDLTLRDRDTPGDPIIVRRIRDIENEITMAKNNLLDSECQLEVLRGSGRDCQ